MKLPRKALRFMDKGNCFARVDDEDQLDMVVYSGGVIKNHWWWGNLAIDLSGMSFPKRIYPILEGHDTDKKIGFSQKPLVNGNLKIGKMTFVDTSESQEFRKLSKEGFPYESSMYAMPTSVERVSEGEKAEVNGMKITGPVSIWRKCIFKEASVCVFGWDSNTKSVAFAEDDEIEIPVETTGQLTQASESQKTEKEVKEMTLTEFKKDNPEAYTELMGLAKTEVKAEIETTFNQEIETIKQGFSQEVAGLKDEMTKKDERILKLEKKDTIREEAARQLRADQIWSNKLAESSVPEHLMEKVKPMVSYIKFVKDGQLDAVAFSKAVDDEIKDWESRGISTEILGTGFSVKEAENDKTKLQREEKADDEMVDDIFALSGAQKEVK